MNKQTQALNSKLSPQPAVPEEANNTPTDCAQKLVGLPRWVRHHQWLLSATVGLVAFLSYLNTLAPTVLATDSGRFQARAYVLGIGHPTGYPTYIMLGKLFTFLPIGDVAYRVNLSSAVYAAASVVTLYYIVLRLCGWFPAVVSAFAFAFSQSFWRMAVVAEVYTLNVLFLAATLLALLLWRDRRNDRYLLLAAFLAGLALTNHLTSGLLIPAGGVFVLLTQWRTLVNWRLLVKMALCFLLGLTPYLYLPIRALMNPPLNYGNPSTLDNFVTLVTGRQFQGQMWIFGLTELPDRLTMYWSLLQKQYHPLLLILGLLGLVGGWRMARAAWGFILVLYAGNLIHALEYDIRDIFVYFIPTYFSIAVWVGAGLRLLMLATGVARPSLHLLETGIVGVALLLVLGRTWDAHHSVVDASGMYQWRNLIERVADLPQGSVVYDTQNTTPLQYLTHVERRRLDLTVKQVRTSTVIEQLDSDFRERRQVYFLHDNYANLLRRHGYILQRSSGLWRVSRPPDQATSQPPPRVARSRVGTCSATYHWYSPGPLCRSAQRLSQSWAG